MLVPLLALALMLVSAAVAQAATINVTVTGDPTGSDDCTGADMSCSLRQAVAAASSGDTVVLPSGTYELTQGADIDITQSITIEGNSVDSTTVDASGNTGGGGAPARIFRTDSPASVTIEGLTLTGGVDGRDECSGCTSTINFSGGGALFNDGGNVTLDDVAFLSNWGGTPLGGAVSTAYGTLTMNSVSFTHNSSGIAGALFVRSGTVTGNGVTFDDDSTGCCEGGAAYLLAGTVTLKNTTIVNSAALDSNPVIANGGATLTLDNDTLSDDGSDIQTDTSASTTVENTILGAPAEGAACEPPGRGDEVNQGTTGNPITTDSGHNIDAGSSCGLNATGDHSNADPKLASIADNGGPVQTEAVLHGSPALGGANETNCPAMDARGVPRANPCDIGALEVEFIGFPSATTEPAQNIQQEQADLRAQISFDGEAGGLHFLWGTSPTSLTNSTAESGRGLVSEPASETQTLTGLNPGTTYYYQAVADNATGSASGAAESFTTPPGPPSISNVNVDSVTDTTADLEFSIDPQGSDTQYWVEYGSDQSYGQQTQPVDIGSTAGAQDRHVTLTGLDPGSTYHFDVFASNGIQQNVDSGDNTFATDQQVTGSVGSPVTATDSGTFFTCPSPPTVDWGDGNTDTAPQPTCMDGQDDATDFEVSDTHTYQEPGRYTIQIEYDDLGYTTTEYAVISGNGQPPPGNTPPANTPPPAGTPTSPPTVTGGAASVTATKGNFTGTVNPDGLPTQAFFEYGLDPKYSGGGPVVYSQSSAPQSVGSDFSNHTVGPVTVGGLIPGALYHARLVATNSAGTTDGPDVTFTTAPAPPPGPPTLGSTFNLAPVSGVVLIEVHGHFVPLTGLERIPNGAEINALHGSLVLTTATGNKGKTQHGIFGGAIFKITQERRGKHKGFATLSLIENAFKGAPGYGLCKPAHQATDATAAKVSTKTLQLLHASGHGKFTTKGRYSAATVLGTKWSIADRCDGTLIHDLTDSVLVNDFVHHRTITLHAGQSYLALAHK